MKKFLPFLLISISSSFITKTNAQVNVDDSLALVDLFISTNGPHWNDHKGWLKGPVNNWYGITVADNRVITITLSINGLKGSISESIGNLTKLQTLDLSGNDLSDSIPESIGNLIALQYLHLDDNKLSGSIPESIGNLTKLPELFLNYNQLSGNIPMSIGNLTKLQTLDLSFNDLSDSIPESISNLTALQTLNLFNNKLIGSIPVNIGNLTALQYLNLFNNKLSGSIPISIGNLTKLQSLDLSNNDLSGNIPENIGNLTKLVWLIMENDQLSGRIPESIGNLTALQYLLLNDNQLSGSIPESIGNLIGMRGLNLSSNQLSGNIPESIGNLIGMDNLDLSNNQLSGNIPESIGNLPELYALYLYNNQLSGSIPESIGNLTSLHDLRLNNNQLNSNIPESIGNHLFGLLNYLYLNNNHLSGAIPTSLLNLLEYCVLDLSSNNFTYYGMEEVVQHFINYYLTYAPQGNISLQQQGNLLFVSAGGTPSNNTYKWYRDGALVATNIGDSTFTVTIDGEYNVNVTNSICTALTLYSDTITTGVLPLTILNFSATLQSDNALINWSTANELNTKEFIIQRSTDGVQFRNIGKQNAVGNSSSVTNYHFTDANITTLHSNKMYYRLQQQDVNGSSSYSKTVVLNITSSENNFVVYPNPAKDFLHVQSNGKAIFVLHNSEGKILLTKTIDGNDEINISALAAGLYYLRNTMTGEERKIIKNQ